MEKNTGKVREKSGNFVSPEKVGTLTREKEGDQREEKTLILLHRRRWLLQIRLVITRNISGAFACLQSSRGDRFGRLLRPFITVFISLDACNKWEKDAAAILKYW